MKGPESEAAQADLRAWAAEQLQVGADATGPQARSAFLRLVADYEFLPPSAPLRALRLLSRLTPPAPLSHAGARGEQDTLTPPRPVPRVLHGEHDTGERGLGGEGGRGWGCDGTPAPVQALAAVEARLREEVSELAAEFFDLSCTERQQRWLALQERCQFVPPLRARLMHLRAGLALEADKPRKAPGLVGELAGQVGELFPLRMVERAERRRALLADADEKVEEWAPAAAQLRAQFPAWAALEPRLLDGLQVAWRRKQRLAEEQALAEVDALAKEFFDLPHQERRQRLEVLRQRHTSQACVTRLGLMEARLGLRFDDRDDKVQWLLRLIASLAIRPTGRSDVLASMRAAATADPSSWCKTVQDLRKRHRAIAGMAGGLLDELVRPKGEQTAPQPPAPQSEKSAGILVGIIIGIVLLIVRLGSYMEPSSRPVPIPVPAPPKASDLEDVFRKMGKGKELKGWRIDENGRLVPTKRKDGAPADGKPGGAGGEEQDP